VSMELCEGGELFDKVRDFASRVRCCLLRPKVLENGHFGEEEARSFMERFLSAVEYCHKNAVVHRDIKPENVLYRNRKDVNDHVLMDFGFSSFNTTHEPLTAVCGTPGETAKAQSWSLGLLLARLLRA
jgi:serine/threonine protein kinase